MSNTTSTDDERAGDGINGSGASPYGVNADDDEGVYAGCSICDEILDPIGSLALLDVFEQEHEASCGIDGLWFRNLEQLWEAEGISWEVQVVADESSPLDNVEDR